MYTRSLKYQNHSFFLFGPRGVGKSTWLREHYPDAKVFDLLQPTEFLKYAKNPGLLTAAVKAESKNRWIIIDEVQRTPSLLDEVHHLMHEGYQNFALSGSSARKLKRGAANLLGGRANRKVMHPLTTQECGIHHKPAELLQFGLLPLSITAPDEEQKENFLTSYITTYINEEVRAEGLVRDIGSFSRFLEIAAVVAGTQVNISGLARDAGIGRDTVEGYFGVFEDTLLGSFLPAYRPRAKVKEVQKPKFYWFDPGVLNCAAGAFRQPMPSDWQGVLLEHLVYHELHAYMDYHRIKGSLGFWRTPSGSEVDFVYWYGDKKIGIEVKAGKIFRKEYLKGLKNLNEALGLEKSFLIYQGEDSYHFDGTDVLPVMTFCEQLNRGAVLEFGA